MQRRQLLSRSLGAAALPLGLSMAAAPATARTRAVPLRNLVVDAVQMPAWSTRNGQRVPLSAGDTVSTAHEVETAAGAALVLRLPEGSVIRLGQKTRLGITQLDVGTQEGRTAVRSDLKLFEGFFRFATSAVAKVVGQRQINVTVRTATIGIRGTDFWTMTDPAHDAACVFEGRVDVSTQEQGELTLDKPTAFWARFFDQPVRPVGQATPEQLNTFLKSTELQPGQGIAVVDGTWAVQALVTADARQALDLSNRLRAVGYPARLHSRTTPQSQWHEVLILQLATEADARAVLERIKEVDGVSARVLARG
jgi:hypothetical protein